MGMSKKINAIAPLITVGILLITGVTLFTTAYLVFEKPDITYNITETGFAIFGAEINWFIIIGGIALLVILFIWLRPKKQSTPPKS